MSLDKMTLREKANRQISPIKKRKAPTYHPVMIEDHRELLLASIDPDLSMRFFATRGAVHIYLGLWATWWVNGVNSEAKILVASVSAASNPSPPATARLADLPVHVLQFQTVSEREARESSTDPARLQWVQVAQILAADMEELRTETARRRPSRLTFDATQDTHQVRCFRDPDVLGAYRIRRLDLNGERRCALYPGPAPCPAPTLNREMVVYECFNIIQGSRRSAPCWVYVERTVPRNGRRVTQNKETGYVRDSDLLSAIGEWKTWLLFDPAKTELEFLTAGNA